MRKVSFKKSIKSINNNKTKLTSTTLKIFHQFWTLRESFKTGENYLKVIVIIEIIFLNCTKQLAAHLESFCVHKLQITALEWTVWNFQGIFLNWVLQFFNEAKFLCDIHKVLNILLSSLWTKSDFFNEFRLLNHILAETFCFLIEMTLSCFAAKVISLWSSPVFKFSCVVVTICLFSVS